MKRVTTDVQKIPRITYRACNGVSRYPWREWFRGASRTFVLVQGKDFPADVKTIGMVQNVRQAAKRHGYRASVHVVEGLTGEVTLRVTVIPLAKKVASYDHQGGPGPRPGKGQTGRRSSPRPPRGLTGNGSRTGKATGRRETA